MGNRNIGWRIRMPYFCIKIKGYVRCYTGTIKQKYITLSSRNAIPKEKVDRVINIINDMEDSMTTNIAFHSDDPNVWLALTKNPGYIKMYTSDTGLFVTLAFKDSDITEKLLGDKLGTNLGYVYENMIAQMLRATGKNLFYHTIPYADGKKYYKVDFIVTEKHKISPVEVKSSGYKSHKPVDEFCTKFSDRIMNKYVIYKRIINGNAE